MTYQLPEIAKTAERMLVEIEQAVRRFPRYYKYTVGAELRTQAMHVTELVHRAWRDRARQLEWTQNLVWSIDLLKIRIQLCKQLQAFASFAQFESLARLAKSLGKQAGGWYRQIAGKQHPNGQNGQPGQRAAQRAEKLSTRATSSWEVYR